MSLSIDKTTQLILAVIGISIVLAFVIPHLFSALEASEGCAIWESLTADITGGTVETC